MAKLPDNFVKPPPDASRLTATKSTAPKLGRRARKVPGDETAAVAVAAEAQTHVHSVLVRLSADEHAALTTACTALAKVGHAVTIEDMIRQVIARWFTATRAMQEPAMPVAAPPAASIQAQLRRLAAEPLRRWDELARTLRRWSRVF